MSINFILSMLFLLMKHPLSMGMVLLCQTIFISLFLGMMNMTYWFSYILMLIMVGGMLILFIYMTSIASNEKFYFNMKLLLILLITSILLFLVKPDYFNLNLKSFNNNSLIIFKENINMIKYYNYPKNLMMIMIIIYLLITLIAVVKISKINQGPLRQMF